MKFNTDDDPRRPGEIKPFQQRVIPENELPVDVYSIFALLLGMLGLMTRKAIFSWVSLICNFASVATCPYAAMDMKQMFASFSFSIMGIIMNHMMEKIQMKK